MSKEVRHQRKEDPPYECPLTWIDARRARRLLKIYSLPAMEDFSISIVITYTAILVSNLPHVKYHFPQSREHAYNLRAETS